MKIIIAVIVVLAILTGAGTYWYKSSAKEVKEAAVQTQTLTRDYSPTFGSADAKVILVEFFDPACGTCAQFSPFVKELAAKYDGRLRVVYRYAPFHENSDLIVTLLEALKEQGKFEEALDTLLKNQHLWVKNHVSDPDLAVTLLGETVGIDEQTLALIDSEKIARRVSQDIADGNALGVNKTPSFFVNGKPLQKFGYNELARLVESEINIAYK